MITTEELVRQVRAQIQETNELGPITDETILDALNRGLDYGWDILARNYKSPLLVQSEPITLDADGQFELPDNVFEDRLLKIDLVQTGGTFQELEAKSYRDISYLQSNTFGGYPTAYVLVGRTVQVLPSTGAAGKQVRYWYLEETPKLIPTEARIISFTAGNGVSNAVVVVDNLPTTTSLDNSGNFSKYLNFVDFETGQIRGSAQIQSISGNEITLKLVPTRSTVLNRTIANDIPSTLEIDDYVCGIGGSCVVYFSKPLANMVIQYAVCEIRRSLNYDVSIEERKLAQLENQVSFTFSKRPNIMRVKRGKGKWKSLFSFNNRGN